MATQKQIEANRRNAQKSTGPRDTTETRWNSLKHGLAADHPVLPHEDADAFQRLRAELIETWQPANAQELLLVDQIAHGAWRMERAHRLETALFQAQLRMLKHEHGLDPAASPLDDEALAITLFNPSNEAGYRTYFRYDTRAQATYYRAIDRLRQLQADRRRQTAPSKSETAKLASFRVVAKTPAVTAANDIRPSEYVPRCGTQRSPMAPVTQFPPAGG